MNFLHFGSVLPCERCHTMFKLSFRKLFQPWESRLLFRTGNCFQRITDWILWTLLNLKPQDMLSQNWCRVTYIKLLCLLNHSAQIMSKFFFIRFCEVRFFFMKEKSVSWYKWNVLFFIWSFKVSFLFLQSVFHTCYMPVIK